MSTTAKELQNPSSGKSAEVVSLFCRSLSTIPLQWEKLQGCPEAERLNCLSTLGPQFDQSVCDVYSFPKACEVSIVEYNGQTVSAMAYTIPGTEYKASEAYTYQYFRDHWNLLPAERRAWLDNTVEPAIDALTKTFNFNTDDVINLNLMATDPNWQGRGLGKSLLRRLTTLSEAWKLRFASSLLLKAGSGFIKGQASERTGGKLSLCPAAELLLWSP
ncbi:hypothetical protein I302_100225 [Kwoniella bestiolae CBS 10118]|uniref:N-acetyltransferase domain-containing protein n=1 Tax=Kwoniella bestiolae CBS 10118 TaxID=1296100 RepID=A0A1B9G4I1_9TREE|nr:hypothetical protein I302_03599 [Kwoniella bestiolae CBS 10118]OCF25923.1 hypothetical protein I302_03599 [Kwoniella bestiolae CBS 10118]